MALKYRKSFRIDCRGLAYKGFDLNQGDFVLKAIESGILNANEIEAARKAIRRKMSRIAGKMWVCVHASTPVSRKSKEERMGSGKGNVEYYAAKAKAGRILFEIAGVSKDIAIKSLQAGKAKLSCKTAIFERQFD